MALVFLDSFDHYGDMTTDSSTVTRMLSGVYAESRNNAAAYIPSFGARTGQAAMRVQGSSSASLLRLVLPATYTTLYIHQSVYCEVIPAGNNEIHVLDLRDNGNNVIGTFYVQADGSIEYQDDTGTSVARSAANVIVAGGWISLQIEIVKSTGAGVVLVKANGTTVINASGVNTKAAAISMCVWSYNSNTADNFWIDDLQINDGTGTYNNGLLGDIHVATLYPVADVQTGWTAQTRAKFGAGVAQFVPDVTNNSNCAVMSCSDAADMEMGSGDFTFETFVRFTALPTGTNYSVIFGKWREDTNERSYRLVYGGSGFNGSKFQFDCSIDGIAATTVLAAAFTPVIGHYHHVVAQRTAGKFNILVDGVPLSAPVADTNTYADLTAVFVIGGQQGNGPTTTVNGTGLTGFLEEFRLTKGLGRYSLTGFSPPTTAFSRNSTGDPNFALVKLLMGWDVGVIDESSNARTVSVFGAFFGSNPVAGRYAVDDTQPGQYLTVDNLPPRDDTYVEAALTQATGLLTFVSLPATGDHVVSDGKTYNLVTPFVNTAGNVLIGASITATIDNLVAAINGGAGAGTVYGTGTTAAVNTTAVNLATNQMKVSASVAGTGGNALATTTTSSHASWGAATLTGGLNKPTPSSFLLGRLPSNTTTVLGLALVTRSQKTDSGAANVQTSFVTSDGSTANGASTAQTIGLLYHTDNFNSDPSTGVGLTPASFIGSAVRVDRTV